MQLRLRCKKFYDVWAWSGPSLSRSLCVSILRRLWYCFGGSSGAQKYIDAQTVFAYSSLIELSAPNSALLDIKEWTYTGSRFI